MFVQSQENIVMCLVALFALVFFAMCFVFVAAGIWFCWKMYTDLHKMKEDIRCEKEDMRELKRFHSVSDAKFDELNSIIATHSLTIREIHQDIKRQSLDTVQQNLTLLKSEIKVNDESQRNLISMLRDELNQKLVTYEKNMNNVTRVFEEKVRRDITETRELTKQECLKSTKQTDTMVETIPGVVKEIVKETIDELGVDRIQFQLDKNFDYIKALTIMTQFNTKKPLDNEDEIDLLNELLPFNLWEKHKMFNNGAIEESALLALEKGLIPNSRELHHLDKYPKFIETIKKMKISIEFRSDDLSTIINEYNTNLRKNKHICDNWFSKAKIYISIGADPNFAVEVQNNNGGKRVMSLREAAGV